MAVLLAVLSSLLACSSALPALQVSRSTLTQVLPPGSAGLRGSSALVGYDPTNPLDSESTDAVKYQPVPGQTDAANLGTYLNFENSQSPQPIRGSTGGTDPGPSKSI